MTKAKPKGLPQHVVDGLAWPPVSPQNIATYSADLLSDCRKIESERHGGKRGMRGNDGIHLSPDQIRIVAAMMLDTCRDRAIPPPADLVELISHLLCETSASRLHRVLSVSRGVKSVVPDDPRFLAAINFEWENPAPSAREVARAVGAATNTIIAWRRHPAYARERRMIELAREDGLL